jgi:UPF0755 protein
MDDLSTTSPPPARRQPGLALLLAVLGALVVAGALYLSWQLSPVAPASQDVVEVEVMPGWGAMRVAAELEEQGLVRNAAVFRLWLRYRGLDRTIGEGLYDLSPAMSAEELARALGRGGRPRVVRVAVPEGWRAVDIAERLEAAGLVDQDAFMALIAAPGNLKPAYVPEGIGLEGYLFPASYDIAVRSTPESIIAAMLQRFERELTPEVLELLEEYEMSVHEWVTLSSIIQAEAGEASEIPIIAGVFLNRLERGMLLQADPTVAYGLGKRLNELDYFAGDFSPEADHDWNTYTRAGLPLGPISNPGRAALQAIFSPERTDEGGQEWLYFLHTRDGEFRPNLTLENHNRDVERYLR